MYKELRNAPQPGAAQLSPSQLKADGRSSSILAKSRRAHSVGCTGLEPARSFHRTLKPPNSDRPSPFFVSVLRLRLCSESSSSSSPLPVWAGELPLFHTGATELPPSHSRAAELPPAQPPESVELCLSESGADELPFIPPWTRRTPKASAWGHPVHSALARNHCAHSVPA